jgi:SEC-C motif domain protein
MPVCPCGRATARGAPLPLADCCGPFLAGAAAPTAEQLMRSRYTAYVLGRVAYVLATWHASTRPAELSLDAHKWLGLEVRSHALTGPDEAEVEFVARFRVGGKAVRQHEHSCFVREAGRWFYLDGKL